MLNRLDLYMNECKINVNLLFIDLQYVDDLLHVNDSCTHHFAKCSEKLYFQFSFLHSSRY